MRWLVSLQKLQPKTSFQFIFWWYFLYLLTSVWFILCYRLKRKGIENVPYEGPLLLLSNHQSFLDPVLVGVGCGRRRQFYPLARSTLWNNRLFGKLISSMNAIPVERGTADMAAMRRCIDLLKQGQAILIFPEGTRSTDGITGPFASGIMLLIKRASPTVIPVAIEGAQHAWPKDKKISIFGRIRVEFGKPIPSQTLVDMGAEEAVNMLRNQIEEMRLKMAREMKK